MSNQREPEQQKPPAGGPDGGPGKGGPPNGKVGRGLFGWVMIIIVLAMLAVAFQNLSAGGQQLESWSEFVSLYEGEKIKDGTIRIKSDRVVAVRRASDADGPESPVYIQISPDLKEFYATQINELTGGEFGDSGGAPWWQVLLFSPLLLTILLIAVFWFIISRVRR